jgi:hypothetical protein
VVKPHRIQLAKLLVYSSCIYVHNHNTQKGNSCSDRLSLRFWNASSMLTTNEAKARTRIAFKHDVPRNVRAHSLEPDNLAKGHPCR